jgi:hypothetical protein
MLKVKATKPKIKPPIEISDDEFLSTSSTYSTQSSLFSLYLSRKDKDIEEVDKPSLAYTKN